jgi:hypothetical protein
VARYGDGAATLTGLLAFVDSTSCDTDVFAVQKEGDGERSVRGDEVMFAACGFMVCACRALSSAVP